MRLLRTFVLFALFIVKSVLASPLEFDASTLLEPREFDFEDIDGRDLYDSDLLEERKGINFNLNDFDAREVYDDSYLDEREPSLDARDPAFFTSDELDGRDGFGELNLLEARIRQGPVVHLSFEREFEDGHGDFEAREEFEEDLEARDGDDLDIREWDDLEDGLEAREDDLEIARRDPTFPRHFHIGVEVKDYHLY